MRITRYLGGPMATTPTADRRRKTGAALAGGTALLVLLGLLFAVPGPAPARASSAGAAVGSVEPEPLVPALLDAVGVRGYWTAQRRERALPLDLDALGAPIEASGGDGDTVRARAGLVAPRSTGKLFFTTPDGDAVCSASAVNTAGRDVIITAAHCAHGGAPKPCGLLGLDTCPGEYFTNFLFVPRYANGTGPDGEWVGVRAVTHQQWIDREDLAFDQALIQVAPNAGRRLVDVVGGNGLAWNHPARQDSVRVWGWPAQFPYDGETVERCTGSTSSFDGTADAQIECPLTGGASGGPWFLSMLNSDVGFIWAVTSRRTVVGTPYLIARPLTRAITTLVAAIRAGRPVPATNAGFAEQPAAVTHPAAARTSSRVRLGLRAIPTRVGRGQLLQLQVRTARPGVKVRVAVRYRRDGRWRRVAVFRTGGNGVAVLRHQSVRPGKRWYRARTNTRTTDPVRMRVARCPLPLDRSAGVVEATDCSDPLA